MPCARSELIRFGSWWGRASSRLLVSLPLLTVIADVVGIGGGGVVATGLYGLTMDQYLTSVREGITSDDIIGGVIKPLIFGIIIASIACYKGLSTDGGTVGVGRATTRAVVLASIVVIITDFFLSRGLHYILGMPVILNTKASCLSSQQILPKLIRCVGEISDHAAESTFAEVDDHRRATPAIEFRNVHLSFDDKKVLDNLSFKVMRGETKIILGGSGGGKSTIIKIVLGLLKPDAGRALVDGEDITDYNEAQMMTVRKKIGMVFQEGALFDSLSVYENVAYRLNEQGVPPEQIEPEVRRMLRFVNLEDAIDKMPAELSGGMRRRVGIARALIGDPKIVLFDEPTAGLDPPTARTICELAMKLRDLEDVSSIFVTHEMNNLTYLCSEYAVVNEAGEVVFEREGERLCLVNSKVMMMRQGNIIFSGTDESLRNAEDPYIQKFLRGR